MAALRIHEMGMAPVSPSGQALAPHGRTAGAAGFTLLEAVCVLAVVAMLVSIVLPQFPRETSRQRLEGYAVETAALLNADREAARRQHREIATAVDAPSRTVRSGSNGRVVSFPADVVVETLLATRCQNRAAGATIRHLASGMSCGGVIALRRPGASFQVRVNWLTGGSEVVRIN
jgi:general secretion pathway protein H